MDRGSQAEQRYLAVMITVIVRMERGVEALAATLAALVPGAAAGLVAAAVVVADDASTAVVRLADAAGAALVIASSGAEAWRTGAAAARREWIWCLLDGDVPAEGWMGHVERFIRLASAETRALGRPSYRPLPFSNHAARLLEARTGARRVRAGDLLRRELLAALPFKVRPVPLPFAVEREPAVA